MPHARARFVQYSSRYRETFSDVCQRRVDSGRQHRIGPINDEDAQSAARGLQENRRCLPQRRLYQGRLEEGGWPVARLCRSDHARSNHGARGHEAAAERGRRSGVRMQGETSQVRFWEGRFVELERVTESRSPGRMAPTAAVKRLMGVFLPSAAPLSAGPRGAASTAPRFLSWRVRASFHPPESARSARSSPV